MSREVKHFAGNPNYENARKNSELALSELNFLTDKYHQMPDITKLSEDQVSWINERIRFVGEFTKNTHYEGFKFFHKMRLMRNYLSHPRGRLTSQENVKIWNEFFPNIEMMKNTLQNNIDKCYSKSKKKRHFEKFANPKLGSEIDRKQWVDALEDSFDKKSGLPKLALPDNDYQKPITHSIDELKKDGNIWQYIQDRNGLSENLQTDLLEWIMQTQDKLDKEDPFIEEARFVDEYGKISAYEACKNISKTEWTYKRLPSVSSSKRGNIKASTVDFDFYKKEFEKLLKQSHKNEANKENDKTAEQKLNDAKAALHRNLKSDMETNLIDRNNAWRMVEIEKQRKEFIAKLLEKIKKFMELEKLLSGFIDDFGRLWDLSQSVFSTSGFEIIDRFAAILANDTSIMELANILGKNNRSQAVYETQERDKVVIKNEFAIRPAPKGQICGITTGNELSAVLPSELALLSNPKLKKLFYMKFATKQLLSYKYENLSGKSSVEYEKETFDVEKKDPKGPIIICVDTSGSMHGTPENIAKTVTFALSKIAIEEERKCYLISFSTDIETAELDMTDNKGDALDRLVKFLTMSFHGGTDANPALEHAVKMLGENDWKNADVLMISDFVMNNLSDDMQKQIKIEQDKNTEFYSLTIGSSANQNTIECFDHNWLYDMSDPKASRHLVEQLDKLKRR